MSVMPLEEEPILRSFDSPGRIYSYAQEGGEVATIFGDYCRKSLCMESWDFVLDSVAYKVHDIVRRIVKPTMRHKRQSQTCESRSIQAYDGALKTAQMFALPRACMGL